MGTKALARNKANHLVWISCILVMLFRTLFMHHQWGSLLDMGMPPTWEKGSHLPPGTTKLGNLRDSHNPSQIPLPNLIFRIFTSVLSPPRDARNVTGHTGMLGELVGSHTKVVIYPTYTIHCKGCDLCLALYWVQGDVGSDLPG